MILESRALLEFCEAQQPWLLDVVSQLVRHESPSTDKAAVDRCGALLSGMLTSLGGTVERLPRQERGDHIRAEWGEGERQVLLLGHFDTVWPIGKLADMPLRESNGHLYGPGIFDMKAGIAVAQLALRALRHGESSPATKIVMMWTSDEEIGSGTSRSVIEAEARRSAAVLVLEPSLPGGAAKTSRKGVGQFELTVHGTSAHAGVDPEKGASAVHELARQIIAIEALQDLARGITLNVGVIAGGSRPNVIAERARATIDVRVPTLADATRIEAALRSLTPFSPGTRLEVHGGVDRPPFERTEAVARLFRIAGDAASSLGRHLGEGATGGASDGNFTGAIGVPTLDGLGPMGDGAHAAHEHVVISDLPWRAAFLAALVSRL